MLHHLHQAAVVTLTPPLCSSRRTGKTTPTQLNVNIVFRRSRSERAVTIAAIVVVSFAPHAPHSDCLCLFAGIHLRTIICSKVTKRKLRRTKKNASAFVTSAASSPPWSCSCSSFKRNNNSSAVQHQQQRRPQIAVSAAQAVRMVTAATIIIQSSARSAVLFSAPTAHPSLRLIDFKTSASQTTMATAAERLITARFMFARPPRLQNGLCKSKSSQACLCATKRIVVVLTKRKRETRRRRKNDTMMSVIRHYRRHPLYQVSAAAVTDHHLLPTTVTC